MHRIPFVLCLLLWFYCSKNVGCFTLIGVKLLQSYKLLDGRLGFYRYFSLVASTFQVLFIYSTNLLSAFPKETTPIHFCQIRSLVESCRLDWTQSDITVGSLTCTGGQVRVNNVVTALMHVRNRVSLFWLEVQFETVLEFLLRGWREGRLALGGVVVAGAVTANRLIHGLIIRPP